MSLKNYRLESKLVPNYRVKKDDYYLLYVLENNLMFKKYLLNEEYQRILDMRKSDYLEYLRNLMNNSSDIIVKPVDIYAKHSLVTSYTYERETGTSINDMYPKTKLDKFMEALENFYEALDDLSGFDLSVLKSSDIWYTGSIMINGLDESEYMDVNVDKSLINDLLFRGIFKIDSDEKIVISNDDIARFYNMLELNQIDIIEFLNEYIRFVRSECGNCKYVRHLNRKIISGEK